DPLASDTLVGLGGTIRALARMYLAATGRRRRGLHGLRLPAAAVSDLAARLAACNLRRRCRIPGLKAERADVIVAGAAGIHELMVRGRPKTGTPFVHSGPHRAPPPPALLPPRPAPHPPAPPLHP